MNVTELLLFVFLMVSSPSSSMNGVQGSPRFNYKTASESAADLETSVELTIAMKNLYNFTSVPNAMCITYIRPVNHEAWTEYHWTERVPGTNNPTFSSKIRIPYLLKDLLELKFEYYNRDTEDKHYIRKSFLQYKGQATCRLADLLSVGKMRLPIRLANGREKVLFGTRNLGFITVQAEKLNNTCDEAHLTLRGDKIDSKSVSHGLKHYYIEIFKRGEGEQKIASGEDEYIMVYRTEEKGSYGPKVWDPISIPMNTLCGGDRQRELKFVGMDGKNWIGEFETTLEAVEKYSADFNLSNPKNNVAEKISISDFYIDRVPSFADFVAADNFELRLTVAVDFTRKNGLPENPQSFHYRGDRENMCQRALQLVLTAFQDFVWNTAYAIRGFGARKETDVFMILNDFEIYKSSDGAREIKDALRAYRDTLNDESINLGPAANLVPMISRVTNSAEMMSLLDEKICYYVLVVLAVGDIVTNWDMEREIGKARGPNVPLSVIIVGSGDTSSFQDVKIAYDKKTIYSQSDVRRNFHFVTIPESELRVMTIHMRTEERNCWRNCRSKLCPT